MLTQPESDDGAGITPRKGQWSYVEDIFPLHDVAFNKVRAASIGNYRLR